MPGPRPASADVEAFKVNLWQNINMSSRCGGCHKAGGQSPMFARSDDVNQAYSAALTVVNLTQADQSTMVVKVGGGHNCWLSSPSACADILTTWIQNWAGGGAGGAAGSTQIAAHRAGRSGGGSDQAVPGRLIAVFQHGLSVADHVLLALPLAERHRAAVAVLRQQQRRPGLRGRAGQDQSE